MKLPGLIKLMCRRLSNQSVLWGKKGKDPGKIKALSYGMTPA
jgi:hypothetical protein